MSDADRAFQRRAAAYLPSHGSRFASGYLGDISDRNNPHATSEAVADREDHEETIARRARLASGRRVAW